MRGALFKASVLVVFAFVFLCSSASAGEVELDSDAYNPEEGSQTHLKGEKHASAPPPPRHHDESHHHHHHHHHADGGYNFDEQERHFEVMKLSKDEQLALYEHDLDHIRRAEVQPALARVSQVSQAHNQAVKNANFFRTAEQKQRIYSLENELNIATDALVRAQTKEMELYDKMKPLYGIVSYQWMQEQQTTIQSCLKTVNDAAFSNAKWSTIFNTRAESFSDLIVQFFMQWFLSYVVMYPFAAAYYAFWAAPWSIYAYSSGFSDVAVGLGAWVSSTVVILLPMIVLILTGYVVITKYGPELARQAEERREREQQRAQLHRQRIQHQQW